MFCLNPGFVQVTTALAAGMQHTCALQIDGAVICWGYTGNGQLGIGSTMSVGIFSEQMGSNLTAVDLGPGETRCFLFRSQKVSALVKQASINRSNC